MQKKNVKQKKFKNFSDSLFIVLLFLIYLNIVLFYQVYERFWKIEDWNRTAYNVLVNSTFYAMSENIKWQNASELNIFANPSYNNASIILPDSNGKYTFAVENQNSEPIKYNINFESENEKNINLKYKLKLNDSYIVGDANKWAGIEDLEQILGYLNADSRDVLTLEWMWIGGADDNQFAGAKYKLFINISAELQKEG